MTPDQWLGLGSGLLLTTGVVGLAREGLRGGRLWRAQRRRFVCPLSGRQVDCTLVRDVRTGQFKRVEACTAFDDPSDVSCDAECGALMNLGHPLAGEQGRA
jgi:hypothetical protein